MPISIPGYVTVDQAAIELNVSIRTVLYLIERGDLPNATKLDKEKETSPWLIPAGDLKNYQKRKTGPLKAPQK